MQSEQKNKKRIDLLSQAEIDDLYEQPALNDEERLLYFTLNEMELSAAQKYLHVRTRLYFILQLGYFKAKQQFFSFNIGNVIDDAVYVNKVYCNEKSTLSGKVTQEYAKSQRDAILKLYDYRIFSDDLEEQVTLHLCSLIKLYPKYHNALRQLIIYFDQNNIVLPTYRTLQDLFTKAYSIERNRLNQLMSSMPDHIKGKLNALIKNDDGITDLNIIRSDQKDFQYTAVKLEVEKANKISDLYEFSKSFISTLLISKNAVQYYADITEQYAASRVRRLTLPQQWLHLICFVNHRYQQLMNNLITSFMYHVRTTVSSGKVYSETAQMEHSSKLVVDFPKLAEFLKWFPKQKNRPDATYSTLSEEAYKILPEEQFVPLSELISGNSFDKKAAKWKYYGESSRIFTLYLRPILMAVDFNYYDKDNKIIDMMNLLKAHYAAGKTSGSFKLCDDLGITVPKSMLPFLKKNPEDQYIDPHRFEFFVYSKMYHHLDRGRLYCNDSVSYCDIEKIAGGLGYHKISIYCDAHLDAKSAELDTAWEVTTNAIDSGTNEGFNIITDTKTPTWSLLYDVSVELEDQYLSNLPKVEIPNLIKFIGDLVGMWNKFSHAKNRGLKRKTADPDALNACILAEAFGFTTEQMAEISDINYNTLRSTREDFFTVGTMCDTNDLVVNYIHSLPIFKLWDLVDNQTLADADGQKISSTESTIQSRYSKKFFGGDKGISIYTLLANFVAVNAKNIGPNEYEGHSLFDMVYGNKTDINIDMVTGDNHSINKYNHVFLGAIDVGYVPNIKNVREAADDLYYVNKAGSNDGILQAKGKINIERIKKEKRSISRVLLSLITQENTQTTIVRKLNSHTRYASLRAALIEYNRLLNSTHILNLIHNIQLRKVLKTARNRTESYHSLQGLIRKVYNGVFKGRKILNNRISAHATRLVANCIVAYNATILNSIYVKMVKSGASKEALKEFSRISPIAWSHLVFTGRYSFVKSDGKIDIALLVEKLEELWRGRFTAVVALEKKILESV
jgi:TnpA family transposase